MLYRKLVDRAIGFLYRALKKKKKPAVGTWDAAKVCGPTVAVKVYAEEKSGKKPVLL